MRNIVNTFRQCAVGENLTHSFLVSALGRTKILSKFNQTPVTAYFKGLALSFLMATLAHAELKV